MGTYNCSYSEIYDVIEEALDNLEGEVYRKDFEDVCKDMLDEYKHFTDKKKRKKEKSQ